MTERSKIAPKNFDDIGVNSYLAALYRDVSRKLAAQEAEQV